MVVARRSNKLRLLGEVGGCLIFHTQSRVTFFPVPSWLSILFFTEQQSMHKYHLHFKLDDPHL